MDDQDVVEKLARVDERARSNTHRLDKLEPVVDELHNMGKAMVEMSAEMKHQKETLDRIDGEIEQIGGKVELIEKEPAARWNTLTRTIFTSCVSAVAGALATGVLVLLAQYIH